MNITATLLALPALALSTAAHAFPATFTTHPAVAKVQCSRGSGTAVQIAPGKYITARHVSVVENCRIDGAPITSIEADSGLDFDIILAAGKPSPFYPAIDCSGFQQGQFYWAQGHARGGPQRNIMVQHWPAPTIFKSLVPLLTPVWGPVQFIPGMSGGAVFNVKGELVGIVNAFSLIHPALSLSRALRDTPLCS